MSPAIAVLAALSLISLMTGSARVQPGRAVTVSLCGGGAISIPLDNAPEPDRRDSACCAAACHSGHSRKKLDRAQ